METAIPQTEFRNPELALIDAARNKDRVAFEVLLHRHVRWVRGVLFGVLGRNDRLDDLVQQVWTQVWERIGELRDSAVWRCWLYRITRNIALDAGRDISRQRRNEQLFHASLAGAPSYASSPESGVAHREQDRIVMSAVADLPAMYREPFVLRHLNNWSYAQIGLVLDLPEESVETRLVRARKLLREFLRGKV